MSKILYVLSGNLSHTPRALKSIQTLSYNHKIEIIGINRGISWEQLDNELIDKYNLCYKTIDLERHKDLIKWIISKLIELICKFLSSIKIKSPLIVAFSSNRTSILLNRYLNKEKDKNIIIIGHSSGSLYPVWNLSKKLKVPFIFDLEDFHPGEFIEKDPNNEKKRRSYLLTKILPDATFVTVASYLIGEKIKTLVGEFNLKNLIIINNCFYSSEFFIKTNITTNYIIDKEYNNYIPTFSTQQKNKINFVWFSQNISRERGLELIIPQLIKIRNQVHLHLIGNLYNDFDQLWINPNNDFISVYPPMSQLKLHSFICNFDIGLALEPGKDENNLVAVSNKIWAYLQAGLFILATDTPAQVNFMSDHISHGIIFNHLNISKNKFITSHEALNYILDNIDTIRKNKLERFNKAKEYSWEMESMKLNKVLLQVLKINH